MLSRDVGFYTFPFAKESPFLEPIKNVLIQMKKHGILDNIWKRHQVNIDHTCEEKKVNAYVLLISTPRFLDNLCVPQFQNPLGYQQLIFPILLLLFGMLLSMILSLIEFLSNMIVKKH